VCIGSLQDSGFKINTQDLDIMLNMAYTLLCAVFDQIAVVICTIHT